MALAGDGHVVVAVGAQLDRPVQLERCQRSALAEDAGIALLAAEAAPHAPANHLDVVRVQVQCGGRLALVAVGMLGRDVDRHLSVLARHGVGDLSFQIELLLLATRGAAFHPMGRSGDRLGGFATRDRLGRHHEALVRHGLVDAQDGGQLLHRHTRLARGLAGIEHLTRHHHGDRLAQELDLAIGQEGVVVDDRAAVVFARNISRGEHRHHAVLAQDRFSVDAFTEQFTVRNRRENQRGVQGAANLGNVVDVHRLACHVQAGRLMGQFPALLALDGVQDVQRMRGVHQTVSSAADSRNWSTRLRAIRAR